MDWKEQRERMVESQLIDRGIDDERVLKAFREVPRHLFVPENIRESSYGDYPLPIGGGQTISQPFIVAEMSQILGSVPGDKVLEIGTGSGYQAAILVSMGVNLFSVEWDSDLAKTAGNILKELGYSAEIKTGDGTLGWPEKAPYDAIIVTAASPSVPPPLAEQLAEGGRLIIPEGSRLSQSLMRYIRKDGVLESENFGGCVFVPLLGKYGWGRR